MRRSLVVAMLLAASLLYAQTVKPTSITIAAVPGYSSAPVDVAFSNTGDTEITLTISITGPFSLPTNKCGNGVKPGTHCNVYIVYTPEGLGAVTGNLGFTFNNQTVSVPLNGNGVSIIPTSFTSVSYNKGKGTVDVVLSADGDIIPDGEKVYLSCIDWEGVNSAGGNAPLKNNRADIPLNGGAEDWECGISYNGDSQFASSGYGPYWLNLCHGSVATCHP